MLTKEEKEKDIKGNNNENNQNLQQQKKETEQKLSEEIIEDQKKDDKIPEPDYKFTSIDTVTLPEGNKKIMKMLKIQKKIIIPNYTKNQVNHLCK